MKAFTIIKNKYFISALLFVVWMLFFDGNSFLIHHELNSEMKALENERDYYMKEIQKDKELNRLTLVTLLDRIVIHENQELTLVFHDLAELEILQQFSHKETEVI